MVNIYPLALGLALVLAAHGYRKGSLNKSGSLCALIIGYITMGNPLPTFGILLIGFYLAGSKATKVKADVKATLERELSSESKEIKGEKNQSSSHKASTGGQRDALQVLCNSFTSALAALIYRLLYSGEVEPSSIITILKPILKRVGNHTSGSILKSVTLSTLRDDEWCPLDSKFGSGVPKFLLLLAVGHFSCCMGDTLASELGILSKIQPVLVINPFKKVPPGTNGGISPFGTLCSLLGGTFIGILTIFSLFLKSSCLSISSSTFFSLLLLSSFAGFIGSMLDSILGATLQRTWFSKKTKQVLLGRLPEAKSEMEKREREEQDWKVVTGVDVLSNNQVNFISSASTAILTAWIGTLLP